MHCSYILNSVRFQTKSSLVWKNDSKNVVTISRIALELYNTLLCIPLHNIAARMQRRLELSFAAGEGVAGCQTQLSSVTFAAPRGQHSTLDPLYTVMPTPLRSPLSFGHPLTRPNIGGIEHYTLNVQWNIENVCRPNIGGNNGYVRKPLLISLIQQLFKNI